MRLPRRSLLALAPLLVPLLAGAALPLAALPAAAEGLPKTLRLVVPFPPGGTTDILARVFAQQLQAKHGITVLVDNRAGASGTLGSEVVARAAPDGATLLLTATHHVINPALFRKLPYDTRADFTPVALVATAPNALVVNRDFPARDVAGLIALARKEPNKLSFGSSGTGGANHLAGELFAQMAGIEIVHVPYKGAAPAMNDLVAGHIPIMFDTLPTVLPNATAGKLRVLAVTSKERAASLPDVPTLDEAGVKGFEATAWFGLYMPRATDPAVQARTVALAREILATPALAESFAGQGVAVGTLSGDAFARFVDDEIAKWAKVVATAKVPQQ
jgi:tripartite-type tricarboxylate transporter receptor subunit TctC